MPHCRQEKEDVLGEKGGCSGSQGPTAALQPVGVGGHMWSYFQSWMMPKLLQSEICL
jgi:hypothetical protein